MIDDAGGGGLRSRRAGGWSPSDEPSSVYGGVGVDGHPELVDGDVMVVPAEGDEIGGIMVAA
jgi:hypothetical protein